ncbi:MAG: hypothetical protein MPK62_01075 [Alphaproteobacteria bacterium]|nr:hypothetical protein [Alphaproteobacteria bacterium]MDA8029727.1 hypothetical protein [Alphaproteobacteria bacterium]
MRIPAIMATAATVLVAPVAVYMIEMEQAVHTLAICIGLSPLMYLGYHELAEIIRYDIIGRRQLRKRGLM